MAELEAARIMAEQARQEQAKRDAKGDYGKCVYCDNHMTNPAIYNSHTPGCCVSCEQCWLKYHHRRGSTVAEVLESYRQEREYERKHPPKCARCGRPGAWNSGAGQALCERHWDEH
jgi:hypothetical protein